MPESDGVTEFVSHADREVVKQLNSVTAACLSKAPVRVEIDDDPELVAQTGRTVLSEEIHPSGGSATCLDDQGVPFTLWQPAPGY